MAVSKQGGFHIQPSRIARVHHLKPPRSDKALRMQSVSFKQVQAKLSVGAQIQSEVLFRPSTVTMELYHAERLCLKRRDQAENRMHIQNAIMLALLGKA
jgi:hypothetical protein